MAAFPLKFLPSKSVQQNPIVTQHRDLPEILWKGGKQGEEIIRAELDG
jgi:hypothetical protein